MIPKHLINVLFVIGSLATIHGRKRIWNGQRVTDPTKYPWIGYLMSFKYGESPNNAVYQGCVGNLLRSRWALTTHHCYVEPPALPSIAMCMGSVSIPICSTKRLIARMFRHPHFDAIMLETTPFMKSDKIGYAPIMPMFTIENYLSGDFICNVPGWGEIREGVLTQDLMEAQMLITGPYRTPDNKVEMLAVTSATSGTCAGDAGSPLVCGNVVVGILTAQANTRCEDSPMGYYATFLTIDIIRDFIEAPSRYTAVQYGFGGSAVPCCFVVLASFILALEL